MDRRDVRVELRIPFSVYIRLRNVPIHTDPKKMKRQVLKLVKENDVENIVVETSPAPVLEDGVSVLPHRFWIVPNKEEEAK